MTEITFYLPGATMYLPEKHTRMARAAGELRLPVVDFAEGYNREERILYYLREVHLRYSDLGSEHTPYNLRPAEMKSPKMLRWCVCYSYISSRIFFNSKSNCARVPLCS